MMWALFGLAYAAVYAALMMAFAGAPHVRLVIGDIALLVPPLAPLWVIQRSRRRWTGRQAVFWGAIALWAALWLIGEIGWGVEETILRAPLPWFHWHRVLRMTASALPLIALVAWPHGRRASADTWATAALDIVVLVFLGGFLCWSLVIGPGAEPGHGGAALRILALIGPLLRVAAILGLGWAAFRAGKGGWADVYRRLALGMVLALGALVSLSILAVHGQYQTGSPSDIGWMLPFWFAAWAAATSPASPIESRSAGPWVVRPSSPALLFAAILVVPAVGYSLRYLVPAGEHIDRLREVVTSATLVCGLALIMIRLRVEQAAVERANQGVRLLATACQQAGELILILRDQQIEYANDAFCRACGYAHEDLEQLPPSTLLGPGSRERLPQLREEIRARRVVRTTASFARKDGTLFEAACVVTPLVNAAGQVTHVVCVIRDTTEEQRLRDYLVRGERMSAIGEFVSGVAHELNNPLQSVIGTLELILGDTHPPQVRADLERARLEAGRAGRIIRNLLTFVRQSPNERMLAAMNEIVQATVGIRAYELEMAGIEVREDYAPNLPVVLVNRDDIQQVVLNLIINAEQAMEANGRGVLSIRTFIDGDAAVVEVCDDGPGIPPELAGRIFEPFFTTRSPGSATGLGLSLAFGLAKAHGGTLTVMPRAQGACFQLSLPGAGFPGPSSVH